MLKDRIKKNEEYFKSIEIHNGYLTMTVQFKDKWGVFPSPDEKIKVGSSPNGKQNEWVYYGKYDEITSEDIFDLVEQTVEVNLEAALKIELLKKKIDELKSLFAKTPYSKLETLTFHLEDENKSKTKPKKQNKRHIKQENVINEESITNDETSLKTDLNDVKIENNEVNVVTE